MNTSVRKRMVRPTGRPTARPIRGGGYVAAGYPAEAYNYTEPGLDLNSYIIGNKRHNGCVWATDLQMTGEGIAYGDLVVCDSSLHGRPGAIGLYRADGAFTLRREVRRPDGLVLAGLDERVAPIAVASDQVLERIGIVTHVVKKFSVYRNNYGGLPEDAGRYVRQGMDYARYLIPEGHWPVTFYLWAAGESMSGDGISTGDLLLVDNTVEAYDDSILVFVVDGQFTLKRIVRRRGYNELVSSNPAIPPIRIAQGAELERWGVLTGVVKEVFKRGNDDVVRPSGRQ